MESGFIPGIYNYCDRWCEKCEQRLHCMSYVMGKKIEEKGGFNFDKEVAREDENVWKRLKEVFESTYKVLHELAQERGIKVEDIYKAENIEKEFWGEDFENQLRGEKSDRLIEKSDVIRISMIYECVADRCLEKIYEFIDSKEEEKEGLDETLDIVNWYLDLIQAKMRHALYNFYHHQKECGQEEYNGAAKVALISVERSINGWKALAVHCPDQEKEIGHVLMILAQLDKEIEELFPDAREFKRPGFEKPVDDYQIY